MITGYEEWKRNVFEEGEALGLKKGEAIGVKKGEAIGVKKGEEAMRKQSVLRMLSKGLSEAEVADLLGLSTEEVSSIASESENDSKA